MTKHRLGHKGTAYLSALLDANLIHTNRSSNISVQLWSEKIYSEYSSQNGSDFCENYHFPCFF